MREIENLKNIFSDIQKGVSEIIDLRKIENLILRYYKSGKNFRVKAGFDPTGSDLHLGHTVLLHKLKVFQKYGGIIQLIIGDFTAKIGDPTGKSKTRKILSEEEIINNAKTYTEQVFKILDKSKTEIFFNSFWLNKLGSSGIIDLTRRFSIARMLERDDFKKRYSKEESISISEFIYPLLQGYDSVSLKSDIEIGGNDQKFNLLMGRTMQKSYIGNQQAILMMPILEGVDGVQKMSKSLNNYIGITESADTIYAKILSVSDKLMWRYYELLTSLSIDEISILQNEVENEKIHPKKAKEDLARKITNQFYNEETVNIAQNNFNSQFKDKNIPINIEEFKVSSNEWICKILVNIGMEKSTSQGKRDIKQGALKIDKIKIMDEYMKIQNGEYIIQLGKRKFAKIKVI